MRTRNATLPLLKRSKVTYREFEGNTLRPEVAAEAVRWFRKG
jgi:hypothetical protein